MLRLIIPIKVVILSLFCSSALLGMKRANETNTDKTLVLHNNINTSQTKLSMQDKLNRLFVASMPNLNIVDILYRPENEQFAQLSVHEKLSALTDLNVKRQKTIDNIQKQRRALLLSLPDQVALLRLESEEKHIPIQLKKNKNIVQNKLRDAYKIAPTSQEWMAHMYSTQAIARFNLQSMKQSCNNATWDINTPYKFALFLLKHTQLNGLDPSAFNVRVAPDKWSKSIVASFKPARPTLVSVNSNLSFEEFMKNPKQEMWHYEKNEPALIRFNPIIAEYDDDSIDFIVGHELSHALNNDVEGHSGTLNAVVACAQVNPQEVELHPDYTKLILAQENTADTKALLQDHTKANVDIIELSLLYPESANLFAMIKANNEIRAEIAARKQIK